MTKKTDDRMEKIASLAKRRGFVYQGSEIYGGLAGTWDFGPLGTALARNVKERWWKRFVSSRDDMYGLSSANIMPEKVWEASGHLKGFADPLVECTKCRHRFRADHLSDRATCPDCGAPLGEERMFNMMFPVKTGSREGRTTTAYLRGELAQGMFVNYKNVLDSFRPDLPFGVAQIGNVFRNEISARDFIYRVREFELAEFEYFIYERDWEDSFAYWQQQMREWQDEIGISKKDVIENDLPEEDRAHYSKKTVDFEYKGPIGPMEFQAIAYRTDYDLRNHMQHSGESLTYTDKETGESFVPHVIEPTFGIGRTLLVLLLEAYTEEEERIVLKFKPSIAPVKVAVFPLLRNKPELVAKAREIYGEIKGTVLDVMWDDNGNVGKRYRRQDEIGTPYCVTVDFDTLEDDSVTVRDRDSMKQERVASSKLSEYFQKRLS